jgi:hypothetical protein
MSCACCYKLILAECPDAITLQGGLQANTTYYYVITDKFGNQYGKEVESDGDGYITIDANDFPKGYFMNFSGQFELKIYPDEAASTEEDTEIELSLCEQTYSCVIMEFSEDDETYGSVIPDCEQAQTPIADDEIPSTPAKTFCDAVDDCMKVPTANGSYVLKILNGVKSWIAATGAVVINKTLAQFLALAADGDLQFPATYKITDVQNGMFVETLSASTYDRNTLLSLNCPKTYATTTLDGNVWKGIWRSSKTANVNDLFIWGGVVWKNKTGNIGSATDIVTLDSTNWDYINRNSFSNNEYIPLLLKCQYDFEEEWVNLLADEHGNIIGVDWHLNELYGITYNPAERTDWNCMTKPDVIFSNNQLDCIYNNLGNVISNKINGFIYNNDGNVSDNKYLSVIANNEQDVYENIGADYDIDGAVNEVNNVNGSSFFFTHNFSDSPLTSGNSALYNFIPQDAILTSLSISAASLNGSSIDIGVETDNESAVSLPTALLNGTNTNADVYVVATANRSLSITANGGNITAGTITIKAQFKI